VDITERSHSYHQDQLSRGTGKQNYFRLILDAIATADRDVSFRSRVVISNFKHYLARQHSTDLYAYKSVNIEFVHRMSSYINIQNIIRYR